ncbi:MAG TPA: helix-turn-helix domain-containing protein [Candidatus Acidoferrales bacterium]|nr:helix-turn-helix domain-containing protein [Candidatus Acidoferrales bacterium]
MKPRTAQLGARKNPDSPRVHGLRLAVSPFLVASGKNQEQDDADFTSSRAIETSELLLANSPNGTTGGREREQGQLLTVHEVADLLHVPVSWVYGRMRKRSRERLPGYRLGKYWRFREAEILAWLRSQIEHAGEV